MRRGHRDQDEPHSKVCERAITAVILHQPHCGRAAVCNPVRQVVCDQRLLHTHTTTEASTVYVLLGRDTIGERGTTSWTHVGFLARTRLQTRHLSMAEDVRHHIGHWHSDMCMVTYSKIDLSANRSLRFACPPADAAPLCLPEEIAPRQALDCAGAA